MSKYEEELYKSELRQMFDPKAFPGIPYHSAVFVGNVMLARLDDNLRVKIEFLCRGLCLSIITRSAGLIDRQMFNLESMPDSNKEIVVRGVMEYISAYKRNPL